MASLISIIGLILTLVGALIGAKGYWKEKESNYYGRVNFCFFNLEFYSSMVIQKYKSMMAFVYIAIGTAMQISVYTFGSKLAYEIGLMWKIGVVFLFVSIWFISEKFNEVMAWNVIKKRVVGDYYSQIQSEKLTEEQVIECWENLYYVFSYGKNKQYSSIDKEALKFKINKFLKRTDRNK